MVKLVEFKNQLGANSDLMMAATKAVSTRYL